MTATRRFTKNMRLRRRRQFVAVSETVARGDGHGHKLSTRHFTALVLPSPVDVAADASSRLGITVTKKVGNAPTRNRIRRLVREHLRTTGFFAPGFDVVLIAKVSAAAVRRLVDVAGELASLQRTVAAKAGQAVPC